MSEKRFGRSFTDKDPGRAEMHRDIEAALQDLQGVEIEMVTPATADLEFTVVHKLRARIPRSVQVLLSDKAGIVYASRRVDWTNEKAFLKFSAASAKVLLLVR